MKDGNQDEGKKHMYEKKDAKNNQKKNKKM